MPPPPSRPRPSPDEAIATQVFTDQWAPRLVDLAGIVRGKRGRAAVEAFAAMGPAADSLHREIRGSLQRGRQTRVFDRLVDRHRQEEFRGLSRHAALHDCLWRDEASEAVLRRQILAARQLGGNPRAFLAALKVGLDEINSYAALAGHRKTTITFRKRRFRSEAILAALAGISDPSMAAAFYAKHGGQIVAD